MHSSATACAALALATLIPLSGLAATPQRVVVFDWQGGAGLPAGATELPVLAGESFAGRLGFDLIPAADMRRALVLRTAADPACASKQSCLQEIARELRADLFVSGSLGPQGSGYTLSLAVATPEASTVPRRTFESASRPADLRESVDRCLRRLLEWSDGPPGGPASPEQKPAPPSPVVPPPAQHGPKDGRPVLAILSVTAGEGFRKAEVDSVETLLLSAIEATGRLRVVGRGDLATLVDLEARKQASGCTDDDACMTALAGALGADYVASAGLVRLERTTLLTFKVIRVRAASALVHARATITTDDQLVRASDDIAAEVVSKIFGEPLVVRPESAATGTSGAALGDPKLLTPYGTPRALHLQLGETDLQGRYSVEIPDNGVGQTLHCNLLAGTGTACQTGPVITGGLRYRLLSGDGALLRTGTLSSPPLGANLKTVRVRPGWALAAGIPSVILGGLGTAVLAIFAATGNCDFSSRLLTADDRVNQTGMCWGTAIPSLLLLTAGSLVLGLARETELTGLEPDEPVASAPATPVPTAALRSQLQVGRKTGLILSAAGGGALVIGAILAAAGSSAWGQLDQTPPTHPIQPQADSVHAIELAAEISAAIGAGLVLIGVPTAVSLP